MLQTDWDNSSSPTLLWSPYRVYQQYVLCCLKSPMIFNGCNNDKVWQLTHVRWKDGWLDNMMLRPWHNKFKKKKSFPSSDTYTHTYIHLYCQHLLRFVGVCCSVMVKWQLSTGRTAFGNSDLTNLSPKLRKIYSGFTLIRSVTDSEDYLSWEKRMKSVGSFTTKPRHCLCVCACPFLQISVHVCLTFVSTKRNLGMLHPCRRPCTYLSSFCSRPPVDWQEKKQVGANKWCHSPPPWQLPFPLPFHLIVYLLVQIPVGLFVNLSHTSKRAGQQILPRNFTAKQLLRRVCFTFNDAHIRALGGS